MANLKCTFHNHSNEMTTAIDVANFFIDIFKDTPDPMTHLRIEKFVYEAQAWSLVKLGEPLFYEDIEAWDYGPVIPSVYDAFKGCGKSHIKRPSGRYSSSMFTPLQMQLLVDVSMELGKFSTGALVGRTHAKGGPWEKAYVEGHNNTIPLETIRDYYSSKEGAIYGTVKDCRNMAASYVTVRTKVDNLLLTGQNVSLHGILGVPLTAVSTCGEIVGLEYLLDKINHYLLF